MNVDRPHSTLREPRGRKPRGSKERAHPRDADSTQSFPPGLTLSPHRRHHQAQSGERSSAREVLADWEAAHDGRAERAHTHFADLLGLAGTEVLASGGARNSRASPLEGSRATPLGAACAPHCAHAKRRRNFFPVPPPLDCFRLGGTCSSSFSLFAFLLPIANQLRTRPRFTVSPVRICSAGGPATK